MRLVIDLQAAQGLGRGRGIGRFSEQLALAMVRAPGQHEPIILLNEAMPDTAEILSDTFARLLPRQNIRMWCGLTGCSYLFGSLERRQASERIRAQVIAGLNPDLVHVASMIEGAGDDVISGWPMSHRRLPMVATFYDAIPLLWDTVYLSDPKRRAFYFRHLHDLKHCAALLGISESSRQEAIYYAGCDPSYAFNILAGFDAAMFRPARLEAGAHAALLVRYGLREGFVLFVGAGDPRKNDVGLLEAYARLPAALQAAHQLVIVGSWCPQQLSQQADKLGVREADLVLLPHVPDADLPGLYSISRCFVMPSKHEGFGLPALEAMACGTAVIAGNTTSLPEVVGLTEALFDPYQPDSIADRLQRVLTDETFRTRLIEHGLARAKRFTWTASAKRAWEALEVVQNRHPACLAGRPRNAAAARKPSLAFVSPLPPDASGIADYARDLLPHLDQYYDLTLVTASGLVDDPTLSSVYPVLDEAAFASIAHRFDRTVYQVGNSEFHVGIVNTLLPHHAGVVMLHDAFLGNIPYLTVFLRGGDGVALGRALFESGGWPAVAVFNDENVFAAIAKVPCLGPIFRHALGVMQHSAHARAIVAQYVGREAAEMVRLVPFARVQWPPSGRFTARAALGLPADAPLTCSFGMVAATKRPLDVLEAWHAAFASDAAALLVFVGRGAHDAVRSRATELGVSERVIQTGRTDENTYRYWLDAADIAVQLRMGSRGETSAAIADCMAAGLPVVANAHGAIAELPPDTLVLLPDLASATEIGAALSDLWADPARRSALSAAAARHVRDAMSPAHVAAAYYDAIEHFYAFGKAAQLHEAMPVLAAADRPDAARALAVSFPLPGRHRLLLDASHMSQNDLGTGIQRVIREIGRRLLASPDLPFNADMVRLDGVALRYARDFASRVLGVPDYGLSNPPVLASPGDTLVLMDNYGNISDAEAEELRRQHRLGARVIVVIYDLLPLQRPDWFPAEALPLLQRWLHVSLSVADAALCISRAVAEELIAWLGKSGDSTFVRSRPLDIGWFHLGSDFKPAVSGEAGNAVVEAAAQAAAERPTLLMVGTIEPRKGHAQALAAFEQLWAQDEEVGLTIAGKPGWSTEALQERLRMHPEAGRRLHWLQGPGDADLSTLYKGASGLLVASEGEGFGLPIVEAARAGVPVLARDIPVFREIAGDPALWFSGDDASSLAAAIRRWLALERTGRLPRSKEMPLPSWDDSAAAFAQFLRSDQWPMRWSPP